MTGFGFTSVVSTGCGASQKDDLHFLIPADDE